MIAMTRVVFRAFPATLPRRDVLRQLALFGGAGLAVWLLTATYGLDLSPGFF
jgi:hypothetical protein